MKVEAAESKVLLFETFSLFYYFSSHERFLEELALLKMFFFIALYEILCISYLSIIGEYCCQGTFTYHAQLKNKVSEVKNLVKEHDPDILGLLAQKSCCQV